ncbi:MAG: polysaccharide biosynthesis/export family protein [Croceibacterium sp.]
MFSKKFVALVAILLTAACVHTDRRIGGDASLQVLDTQALPPPVDADASGAVTYRIGPFDRLLIDVFGVEELAREVQVDGSGKIVFPLVGEIQAGGTTIGDLAKTIETGLRGRYVRDPQVTVNLKEALSHTLTVDGEVKLPGQYPVRGTQTLIGAIARAGGTTEFSQLDDVVVFRSVGEQRYVGLYNLEAIRRGAYRDPEIYADDVIVVGDSPARRRFKDLVSLASLLATPLVALLNTTQRSSPSQ